MASGRAYQAHPTILGPNPFSSAAYEAPPSVPGAAGPPSYRAGPSPPLPPGAAYSGYHPTMYMDGSPTPPAPAAEQTQAAAQPAWASQVAASMGPSSMQAPPHRVTMEAPRSYVPPELSGQFSQVVTEHLEDVHLEPEYYERIVEVPKYEIENRERLVEVPQPQIVDRIVEIPQVQEVLHEIPGPVDVRLVTREVPKIEVRQVERIIEVPQIEYQDRYVEVPEVREVVRRVPRVEVREIPIERVIQVPRKIHQEIEQPVYRPVPHLVQQPVEREIPVPRVHIQTMEVVRQVPVGVHSGTPPPAEPARPEPPQAQAPAEPVAQAAVLHTPPAQPAAVQLLVDAAAAPPQQPATPVLVQAQVSRPSAVPTVQMMPLQQSATPSYGSAQLLAPTALVEQASSDTGQTVAQSLAPRVHVQRPVGQLQVASQTFAQQVPMQSVVVPPSTATRTVQYIAPAQGSLQFAVPPFSVQQVGGTTVTGDLFDMLDRNHDGVLTRSEFEEPTSGRMAASPATPPRSAAVPTLVTAQSGSMTLPTTGTITLLPSQRPGYMTPPTPPASAPLVPARGVAVEVACASAIPTTVPGTSSFGSPAPATSPCRLSRPFASAPPSGRLPASMASSAGGGSAYVGTFSSAVLAPRLSHPAYGSMVMPQGMTPPTPPAGVDAFTLIDRNNDGVITRGEFEQASRSGVLNPIAAAA